MGYLDPEGLFWMRRQTEHGALIWVEAAVLAGFQRTQHGFLQYVWPQGIPNCIHGDFPQLGRLFWGPCTDDHSTLGSILGGPYSKGSYLYNPMGTTMLPHVACAWQSKPKAQRLSDNSAKLWLLSETSVAAPEHFPAAWLPIAFCPCISLIALFTCNWLP